MQTLHYSLSNAVKKCGCILTLTLR